MNATKLGVVVIGRNEGERLRRCLLSVTRSDARVYVDSGSTDNSIAIARSMDFEVVELDSCEGFTAARARNAGWRRLSELQQDIDYIQFVDGDCEVREDWFDVALADLRGDIAAVFGRRRERHPDANIYHRACDIEWTVPAGIVNSCGGDVLFQMAALRDVGGYNPTLIAGEEPDLCLRLRQKAWRIHSNNCEMTWHDVAISRFGQWWNRAKRAGFAFAQLVDLHGAEADPAWRRLLTSALAWSGLAVCVLALLTVAPLMNPVFLMLPSALALLFAFGVVRTAWRRRQDFALFYHALEWSMLLFASKFAQVHGLIAYYRQRHRAQQADLIEYK